MLTVALIAGVAGYATSYFARGLVGGVRWFGGYGLVLLADGGIRLVLALPLVFVASPTIAAVAIAAAAGGGALAPLFSRRRKRLDRIGRRGPAEFAVGAAARFALPAAVIAGCEQVLVSGGPLLVLIAGGPGAAAAAGVLFAATLLLRAPVFLFQGVAGLAAAEPHHLPGPRATRRGCTAPPRSSRSPWRGSRRCSRSGRSPAGPGDGDALRRRLRRHARRTWPCSRSGIGGFLAAGTFCQALLARGQGGARGVALERGGGHLRRPRADAVGERRSTA